jgi:hypothetical protein
MTAYLLAALTGIAWGLMAINLGSQAIWNVLQAVAPDPNRLTKWWYAAALDRDDNTTGARVYSALTAAVWIYGIGVWLTRTWVWVTP